MEENQIVEEQSTQEIEKAIAVDKNTVPYTPMSKLPGLDTAVPLNLAGETLQAQFRVQEDIPDVDQYLIEKLNYTSKIALSDRLAAEQIDAVTLAIRQIEKDKGFILADMAGIGKGRVCASVIRYAYVNGYLPIFVTESSSLFTAFYRDLMDIGGLAPNKKANPLILNGYESGGSEEVFDEKGQRIKKKKPSPTSILDSNESSSTYGKEIIVAPEQEEIKKIIKGDSIPKKFDFLMLTYSQLAGSKKRGNDKYEYLQRVAKKLDGKVVIVIDECHNAVGTTSSTGRAVTELIQNAKGVLFSSATFSKRPENMFIYSFKTDIADSPITTPKLIELIKRGGERLIENLASNLVLAQQMLRRQRTYDNCDVEYRYMDDAAKKELFEKYDATIKLYKKLIEFFRTRTFYDAKIKAVERFAKTKKVELSKERYPVKEKGESQDSLERRIDDWEDNNKGKYLLKSFTAGEIGRSTFNFIETLLFALKADFVANQAIEQLTNNELINKHTLDGTEFKSNRKPVIAVRNTLEGIFYYLNINVGDEISKADFSLYLLSLAESGLTGRITLKEIVKTDKDNKKQSGGKSLSGDGEIFESDFEDKGQRFQEIKQEIVDVNLDIPLSPLDYVIDKIQNTKRPIWDLERYQRLTGLSDETFRVGEVTGRTLSLKQDPKTKKYKLALNPKNKSKAKTFQQFNNGIFDVLIINESGSTGQDAHSKSTFADQRPRVMIIHQVELDVATEVQKRGRIHRTGMVNFPSYIYAVSRIPSEIRRLLMLAKKLRSLDANTSGNQKQSAKLSTIRDSHGNIIEDISNKIGDECLTEFVNCADNEKYKQFMPTDNQEGLGKMSNSFLIEQFCRNLELSLCEEQEYFYNTINAIYIGKVKEAKEAHVYDLETNLMDLKAAIRTRTIVEKGADTNPFNSSVYEEDDYILAEDRPYSKEKVDDLIQNLAKGEDPQDFYNKFVDDYKSHFEKVTKKEIADSIAVPDYKLGKDKAEKEQMREEYELKVQTAIENATIEYNEVLKIIDARQSDGTRLLKPDGKRVIPSIIEECYEVGEDGKPIPILEFNNAKFCGVNILDTAKSKYSPMNIELVFCQLSGKPKLSLKPTLKGRVVLNWIINRDVSITRIREIEQWAIDPNKRVVARFLTGNVLGAFSIAKDRVQNRADYSPVIDFVKFTTADSAAIRVGIKLNMKKHLPLQPSSVPVNYAFNSKALLDDIIKAKGGVRPTSNANEDVVIKYENGIFTLYVFGGNITPRKVKKYYSKLYDDGNFIEMCKQSPFNFTTGHVEYTPIGYQQRQRIRVIGFKTRLDSDLAKSKTQEVLDYIYSVDPFNIAIRGMEGEDVIFKREDVFKPEGMQLELEREGEFKYNTTIPTADVKEKLESLSKFDKIDPVSSFGIVYFNRKASVREAIAYGLVPLNSTVPDMVSDTLQSLPTDSDRIKFQEDITKAIKNNESDFNIGMLIEDMLVSKYIPLISIFGLDYNNLEYLGQVFKAFSEGKIELPEQKEKQERQQQQYELEKRPLTIDTAQEFIILLNYKIKN